MQSAPLPSLGRYAVPRVQAVPLPSAPTAPTDAATALTSPTGSQLTGPTGSPVRVATPDGGQRIAQPRRTPGPNDIPQGANVAVPRGSVASAPPRHDSHNSTVYYPYYAGRARVYNNYYYYPRSYYPYGYGTFGLGYFYYDPYTWYDPYPIYAYPSYSTYAYNYGYPTGEVRLLVHPRNAEVWVDGYYAGRVDDFDGFLQSLRVEEGPHMIEIIATGYQTLVYNVRIQAGRKIELRGDLRPY